MNKVALVTGAARGIGGAEARKLSRMGYAVAVNYLHSEEKARELVGELTAQGGRAIAVQADVADPAAVRDMVKKVGRTLGEVTLLVNNAGIAQQDLFQDTDYDQWRRLFAVNVDGAYHTIQAVLPHMLHEKSGCIVNTSSIWGLRGSSCEVGYAATKSAIIGLTRSLALELAPSGIRVNCVAPGVIHTDMVDVLGGDTIASLIQDTPIGRLGTPEDVAEVVAFLAQATFVTGQVITTDGGFTV